MLRQTFWCAVCVCLLALGAVDAPRAEDGSSWLDRLNYYRATATLPPVAEEPSLSGAVLEHARYIVHNDLLEHSQNARKRWATAEGAAAAAVSNLAASTRPNEPESWAVDVWMQAPFHALGILDPALSRVGFGIHRASSGRIQTAAGLDVIRGRSATAASVRYPIVWPANGASVPLTSHVDEYPSPLTSCPGYSAPTGLPLIVQLGRGDGHPEIMGSVISDGEAFLEHCVFDERSYTNRHAEQQALARRILDARDAIVLIPRKPLRPGATYRVIIEVNRRRIDWTFSVTRFP
jgi:hypothetical protein